jgi:MFS family permease
MTQILDPPSLAGLDRPPVAGHGESAGRRPASGGRHRDVMRSSFARIWFASTVSGVGDGVRVFALPWLAMSWTGDPRAVSLVLVATQLPWLLLGLLTGALADRWDRRTVLWLTNALRAALVGAFPLAMALDAAPILALAALGFLLTTVQTLHDSAAHAILPSVVRPGGLPRANGRLLGSQLVALQLVGPSLGATLCTVSAVLPFLLDSVSFLAASVVLLGLRGGDYRPAAAASGSTLSSEVTGGLRWLLRHTALRRLCLMAGVVNVAMGGVLAVNLFFAYRVLHLGATGCAVLMSLAAIGGVAGAAATPRASARWGHGRTVRVALLAAAAALLAGGTTSMPLVAGASLLVFGAAAMAFNVVAVSYRQAAVPADLLGRVSSAYNLIAMCMTPVGTLAGGILAHAAGVRVPIVAAAVLILSLAALPHSSSRSGNRPPNECSSTSR